MCLYTPSSTPEGIVRVVNASTKVFDLPTDRGQASVPLDTRRTPEKGWPERARLEVLGHQCPTIPAFSALSHWEVVVFLPFALRLSRLRFTEIFPKDPSSTHLQGTRLTWFRSWDL